MKKQIFVAAALAALISASPVLAQGVGFGDDIPLQFAVKRIVPEGMNVKLSPGVDGDKQVSWTGGDNWRQALEQAVAGTGYTFTVNSGEVVIAAAPETSPAAVAPKQVAEAPAAKPAVAPPRPQNNRPAAAPSKPRAQAPARPQVAAPVASVPVVPGAGFVLIPETAAKPSGEWQDYDRQAPQQAAVAPVEPEWVVAQGDDLKAVLEAWATKSGWRLVWESEYTYSLRGAARFRGDFVTASTELLRSMQDVRPVPTANFYQGNMVLVIANNGLDEAN